MGRLRITGGDLGRRLIDVPAAADTGALRPTSDKVRQAIFASLQSRFDLDNRSVLDIFCGSGALGFEGLSRGACSCVFVDDDKNTMNTVRDNAFSLGVLNQCRFVVGDAVRYLSSTPERFDLVLVDPPYARALDAALLAGIRRICRPGGVVVIERGRKMGRGPAQQESRAPVIDGLSICDERRYGDTRVDVYLCGASESV